MLIRRASREDLLAFAVIEQAACELFRGIGMAEIADDAPFTIDELVPYQRADRAWVTEGDTGTPVAYLLADVVDDNVHIEQVSVHPSSAHRGVGRALIDHVAADASTAGTPAITLTTFAAVPWNGPYYARCGFRMLPDDMLTAGLREIRRQEAARGLDRWPRICMRRDL